MNPAIHAALAAARRRREEEEEKMIGYNPSDLEGWEFKIVRSHYGKFGKSEIINRVVSEEAQNGWELLEKLDDCRIRFKRRTDKRSLDSGGDIDPYRTSFGKNPIIFPIIAVLTAAAFGAIFLMADKNNGLPEEALPAAIFCIVFALVLVMIIIRRNR
jgi:hypothetical protein